MKTIVFENNDFFWKGFEDFLKTIDTNFYTFRAEIRDAWDAENQKADALMVLSQPLVDTIVVNSAFETQIHVDDKVMFQIEYYINIIDKVVRFREHVKYNPLKVIICYNGENFIEDVNELRWGYDFTNTLNRVIRQNVDNFKVFIYTGTSREGNGFQLVKQLEESDFNYK